MKTRLGTVIVAVLATLGAVLAFLGSTAYFGYVGAMNGFVAACHTLHAGETRKLITRDQRAAMANAVITTGGTTPSDRNMVRYFMSDCSKSPLASFTTEH